MAAVVVGATLDRHQGPGPLITGQVTVTGFGVLSVVHPSSKPTSVTLSDAQTNTLNALVSALPRAGHSECHENATLFMFSVVSRVGGATQEHATDRECPAPGVLALPTSTGAVERLGGTCALRHFLDGIFPGTEAQGTKSALRHLCG